MHESFLGVVPNLVICVCSCGCAQAVELVLVCVDWSICFAKQANIVVDSVSVMPMGRYTWVHLARRDEIRVFVCSVKPVDL